MSSKHGQISTRAGKIAVPDSLSLDPLKSTCDTSDGFEVELA